MSSLCVSGLKFEKSIVIFETNTFFIKVQFSVKIKILKSSTKNALFGCFGPQFRKTILILETGALEFVLLLSLVQT